ncbi:MAG: hypothetical protein INQ03_00190 [Candidatus Heimdallarchaeota archaeon]|nr:hypothetical protein [Candidatus Heimdallarchaeota archaeon]
MLYESGVPTSSHILIFYFDDVLGQQVLVAEPPLDEKDGQKIINILYRLVDTHFDIDYWQFSYADKLFSSLNLKFSYFNANNRGGAIDYVITLLITPSTFEVMEKTLDLWEYVSTIHEMVALELFIFDNDSNKDETQKKIGKILADITKEVDQMINKI